MPTSLIPITAKSRSDIDPTMNAEEYMGLKRNFIVDNKGRLCKRPVLANASHKYELGVSGDYITGIETGLGASLENRSTRLHFAIQDVGSSRIEYNYGTFNGSTWSVTDYSPIANITTSPRESYARTIFLPGLANSVTNTVIVVHPNSPSFIYFDSPSTGSEITPSSLSGSGIRGAAVMNRRLLLGAGNTESVYYSDINNLTTWSGTSFFSSELTTDGISNLYVSKDQLFVIGGRSTEVWQNDGIFPFSRIPGATFQKGNEIKYGPVASYEEGAFLYGGDGQFYFFDGRSPQQVAGGVTDNLYDLGFSTTIFGHTYDHFKYHNKNWIYLRNDDNQAIFIDIANDDYSIIDNTTNAIFNSSSSWDVVGVRSGLLNSHLFVGSRTSGNVAALKSARGNDYDGNIITSSFKTGWVNHRTEACKRSRELRIKVLHDGSGNYPTLTLNYYNNGSSTQVASHTIDISSASEQFATYRLHNLGMYRQRQWEISSTSQEHIVISQIEEDFEVLQ